MQPSSAAGALVFAGVGLLRDGAAFLARVAAFLVPAFLGAGAVFFAAGRLTSQPVRSSSPRVLPSSVRVGAAVVLPPALVLVVPRFAGLGRRPPPASGGRGGLGRGRCLRRRGGLLGGRRAFLALLPRCLLRRFLFRRCGLLRHCGLLRSACSAAAIAARGRRCSRSRLTALPLLIGPEPAERGRADDADDRTAPSSRSPHAGLQRGCTIAAASDGHLGGGVRRSSLGRRRDDQHVGVRLLAKRAAASAVAARR